MCLLNIIEGVVIMNEKEFIDKMIDLMDTEEEINMDSNLADIEEWDSLSYISFLAFCRTTTEKKVSPAEVKGAKTIRDLYNLAKGEN